MDMTMSSATPSRMEVVTSVQRRRRWPPEQKLEVAFPQISRQIMMSKLKWRITNAAIEICP